MALIKTTDELKQYIVIDVNLKFNKIQPAIDTAEIDLIKPLLGEEFYAELLASYNALPTAMEASLAAILPYVQKALANYAVSMSIEKLGVAIGDAGIQQQFSQNSQPAPGWKVSNVKLEYLTSGDKAADLLLEFLEEKAVIPDGGVEADRVYKKWYDSEANTALSGCIVYKTSIANKYIDIGDSRRLFLRLKKRIKEVEATYVKRLVCTAQYAEILEQLTAGGDDYTDETKSLVAYLEPIIAKRALYNTLPFLPVIVTADGLFLITSNDSTIQKLQAGQKEKADLQFQLKDAEDVGYLADEARLHEFLTENIADYPLISASPCWAADVAETNEKWKIDNDPCNKGFSV